MKTTNLYAADERGRRFEEVFDKYHARLRRYFSVQLGDGPEADACAAEAVRRLFDFMEGREWGYVNGRLMIIAFGVCSDREAERDARGAAFHIARRHAA
jgi:hypothetical protein